MYIRVNEFDFGFKDSIFSGNEQQKVYEAKIRQFVATAINSVRKPELGH